MKKGSLFFVYFVIFPLIIGLFEVPSTVCASNTNTVTVSAVVLEHLTYQKTVDSVIISTNQTYGITIIQNSGYPISGKVIEIPLNDMEITKNTFYITANF